MSPSEVHFVLVGMTCGLVLGAAFRAGQMFVDWAADWLQRAPDAR